MVVTDEMIDSCMEALTDYFNSAKDDPRRYIDKTFFFQRKLCSEEDSYHLVEVLKARDLITVQYNKYHECETVLLAPKGHTYFEDKLQQEVKTKEDKNTKRAESGKYWLDYLTAYAPALAKLFLKAVEWFSGFTKIP